MAARALASKSDWSRLIRPMRSYQTPKLNTLVLRAASTTPSKAPEWNPNFDPNNYTIPPRIPTLDDCMEPYGSWHTAYAAEKKRGNMQLVKGALCLTVTMAIFYYTGTADSFFMPNLDNIMEETEPFNFDTEDRVTVKRDDDE